MERESKFYINYFRKKHGIEIDAKLVETGWESVTLYHEEIEDILIPREKLHTLPNPLLYHLTVHDDEEGQEWLFVLVADSEGTSKGYSAYCLLNGELIDSDIPFAEYL